MTVGAHGRRRLGAGDDGLPGRAGDDLPARPAHRGRARPAGAARAVDLGGGRSARAPDLVRLSLSPRVGSSAMAKPVVGITTYLLAAKFGSWDTESALVPADYVRAIERAGGRPLLVPPSTDGDRRDARRGRRARLQRRLRHRPRAVRPRPASGDRRGLPRARRRRAGAAAGGARARHAGARDLPRLATAERRARRRPRPAPARTWSATTATRRSRRSSRSTASTIDEGTMLHGLVGEHSPIKSHHHQGFGRVGDGPARRGARRGRHARGARGDGRELRARRALASRGRRGRAAVRGAGEQAARYRAEPRAA